MSQATASPPKLYRRNSAGGQALQQWQNQGKHTTIHVAFELERHVSIDQLKQAVETKLLLRFPRFRGHVTDDESHWCVPEKRDPNEYVVPVELVAPTAASEPMALQRHVAEQMTLPLPPRCSWNVHLITYSGSSERCCVLWRISHTVADGVVLAQIMSRVLCEEIAQPRKSSPDGATRARAASPRSVRRARVSGENGKEAHGRKVTDAPRESEATVLRRRVPRAGLLERVWCFVCGLCFVLALPFWPADVHTPLQLGPYRWKKRRDAEAESGSEVAIGNGVPHAAGEAGVRIALGKPIPVEDLRSAAAAAGITINDLLMAAMAGAIRQYLKIKAQLPSRAKKLTLTAVAVVNPRPTMPQDMTSDDLLRDYATMRGPGCDITLLLLPLPCGEMSAHSRRDAVARTTRKLKLSPEAFLLRLGAKLLTLLCGLRCLIALYTVVLAKFTLYVSNVVAPPQHGAFCGVPISAIWFGTTPLDFGVSFSFLSYAGSNRVCCVADGATVPEPQMLADLVYEQVLEQMACAVEPPAALSAPGNEVANGATHRHPPANGIKGAALM